MSVNRYYSNTAVQTELSAGINNSQTSMAVASVSGFPVSYPYTLIIDEGLPTEELVEVTGAAGTTLTVTRGVDNTSASTHSASAEVRHGVSARDFREVQEHIADPAIHVVDQTVLPPTGMVTPYAGSAAPDGWLLADGSAVSRSTYADLYDVCGDTYGNGDGSTTFNLPNLKGRVPVGLDGTQTEFDARGNVGGEKDHALTVAEMPTHSHTIDHDHPSGNTGTESADHAHSGTTGGAGSHAHGVQVRNVNVASGGGTGVYQFGFGTYATDTNDPGPHAHGFSTGGRSAAHTHAFDVAAYNGSSGNAGSGNAHNNLQPYVVLNYIIKT